MWVRSSSDAGARRWRLAPRGRDTLLADESFQPGWRQQEQHSRSILTGGEAVRDVARTDHEISRLRLDGLLTDLECEVPLGDEERLLLAVVDVGRGHPPGRQGQLDDGEPAVGLAAVEPDLCEVAPTTRAPRPHRRGPRSPRPGLLSESCHALLYGSWTKRCRPRGGVPRVGRAPTVRDRPR